MAAEQGQDLVNVDDEFSRIMGEQGFSPEFVAGTSQPDLEPFGTALGVKALESLRGTGGATNPKGDGKYDDYKTQDE